MHDHDGMTWRDEAVERVLALRAEILETHLTVSTPVDRLAGRTLATEVVAESDSPPQSHATMDGFAFDATDEYPLTVADGEVFPEDDCETLEGGAAIRIATGAPLPEGANAVLKREEATVEEGTLTGPDLQPGTYVYERGSNYEAGDVLFPAGERLAAKDAILLSDLGYESVPTYESFDVRVLATGTEIHEGHSRDLDSPMLASLVRSWGHDVTIEGTVPDEYDAVETAIADRARESDVVVTTGGTSVGHKDYVVRALSELGEVLLHRVRIRPGKPIAVARLPAHDAVAFAIPGKPIGAHTVTSFVARPFFTGTAAEPPTITATLTADVGLGPSGFEYVVPVVLHGGEATPLGHAASMLDVYSETFDPSVLSSTTRASRADGVVLTTDALDAEADVAVVPWSVLERW